jgi:hypothetical protein
MTQLQSSVSLPPGSREYLAQRLDGARDLYVLALALGARQNTSFGPMIRESRIHFVAVIEEARLAGLDTRDIGNILAQSGLEHGIRPELRASLEHILAIADGPSTERPLS